MAMLSRMVSSSELHARGRSVHSPSDIEPILGTKTKDIDDDSDDELYHPPKHSNVLDDEAPEYVFTDAREEATGKTDFGHELVGW